MREIKFRIFDKEKSKIRFDFIIETKSYEKDFNKCIKDYDWNIIENVEIMQYTWLKDKNWKEIYEWDIVKWFYNYSVEIKKAVVWFRIGRFEINSFRCIPLHEFLLWHETKLEIIGNIYENPELNPDI